MHLAKIVWLVHTNTHSTEHTHTDSAERAYSQIVALTVKKVFVIVVDAMRKINETISKKVFATNEQMTTRQPKSVCTCHMPAFPLCDTHTFRTCGLKNACLAPKVH